MLVNITGGDDLTLGEGTQINEIIHDAVGDEAEIIFGAVNEPAMQGEIRVTVIATGFDRAVQRWTQPMAVGPPAGRRPACILNFPTTRQPALGAGAAAVRAAARPTERRSPAACTAGPARRRARRRRCPRWRFRPSSAGRWTDARSGGRLGSVVLSAAAVALVGLRRSWPGPSCRWPSRSSYVGPTCPPRLLDTLRRGETLSELFARQGVSRPRHRQRST